MVSGHLQVKKGYYYAVLSFYDSKNKRHVKYISTGLPEKGNKRKAEAELVKIRNAFEPPAEIGELCSNMLFADYLLGWLEIVRVRVKPRPIPMPSRAESITVFLLANISARPRMMQFTTISGMNRPRLADRDGM